MVHQKTAKSSSFKRFLSILFVGFFLQSCDFDEPIVADSGEKINPKLLGSWEWREGDETFNVEISRLNPSRYNGKSWPDAETQKAEAFTAWTTTIGGSQFWTVDFGSKETHRYMYVRVTPVDDETVRYEQVDSDSAFGSDKQGTVIQRIERLMQSKGFFREAKIFKKKKSA
jgi:hypothetical protein